jgi:hypothetical protein
MTRTIILLLLLAVCRVAALNAQERLPVREYTLRRN